MNGSLGWSRDGVVLLRENVAENEHQAMSHELVHVFQEVRGNAFLDPFFRQNFGQKRPVSFLRLNLGLVNMRPSWIPAEIQQFFGSPSRVKLFHEWEAIHYSGSPF